MSVRRCTLRDVKLCKSWADTDLYVDRLFRYQLAGDSKTEVPELVELQPSARSCMCFYNLCVSIIIKSLWLFLLLNYAFGTCG